MTTNEDEIQKGTGKPKGKFNLIGCVISLGIPIFLIAFTFLVVFPNIQQTQSEICPSFKEIIHSDIPIYSTEDGTMVEGTFFLGCGYVQTKLAYFFYAGNDINGYQRQMLDASNVYVFRDSGVPHLVKKTKYKMTLMDQISQLHGCLPVEIYEMHIPKDTLIKEV